ncbi:MAG: hypothetical protein Q9186_002802 [Xanthomendoza sp. 1 TL-2023]
MSIFYPYSGCNSDEKTEDMNPSFECVGTIAPQDRPFSQHSIFGWLKEEPNSPRENPEYVATQGIKSAISQAAFILTQQIQRLAAVNKHLPSSAKSSLTRLIDHKLQSIHHKITQDPQDDEALGDLECFVNFKKDLRLEDVESKIIDRILQEKIESLLELNGLEVVVNDGFRTDS